MTTPHTITATYRIVTPMFLGGADHIADTIRPPSIKGALRFWWRALNWGPIRTNSASDEAALIELHKQENDLFGSASDKGPGQSSFLLTVAHKKLKKLDNWPAANSSSGYLGMGIWESGSLEKGNKQPHRTGLVEGHTFTVKLVLKDIRYEQILINTLKALGYFGGLGSRARRGFGSIALETINEQSVNHSTLEKYKESILNIIPQHENTPTDLLPPYSAFSKKTKICTLTKSHTQAREAHADVGSKFKNYRGQPSSLRGKKKRVFGMPYNGAGPNEENARRASPLLFHIHPIGDKYCGLAIYMPSIFHHEPELQTVDYGLIEQFMKGTEGVTFNE